MYFTLSGEWVAALLAAAACARERGETLAELRRRDFDVPGLRADIEALRAELMHGRGFAVLQSIPVERRDPALLETLYWGLALQLGTPVSQSTMGDMMGQDCTRLCGAQEAQRYQAPSRHCRRHVQRIRSCVQARDWGVLPDRGPIAEPRGNPDRNQGRIDKCSSTYYGPS